MSIFSIDSVNIAGVSACVPAKEVSNHDFDLISEKERNLFIKATGIENRRVAALGICTSDLCIKSAEVLLKELGWKPDDIEILVFITQTPDYITPATSGIIQNRMGLPKSCIALDINLGCSGYVYGLSVISSLLSHTLGKKGLLLVGDVSSACISAKDKSTTPIFSDAGSATAIENSGDGNMTFNLQGDGSGYKAIIIPDGGYRNPVNIQSLEYHEERPGITRNNTHLILEGIDIYNFSVREVPPNIEALMNHSEKNKDDIDYYVFHQANKLINEGIRKKLGLRQEQVPYSLKNYGNTSSATIPVTIVDQLRKEIFDNSLSVVFSGFGVGLSWSSVLLNTKQVVCPPMIEY